MARGCAGHRSDRSAPGGLAAWRVAGEEKGSTPAPIVFRLEVRKKFERETDSGARGGGTERCADFRPLPPLPMGPWRPMAAPALPMAGTRAKTRPAKRAAGRGSEFGNSSKRGSLSPRSLPISPLPPRALAAGSGDTGPASTADVRGTVHQAAAALRPPRGLHHGEAPGG